MAAPRKKRRKKAEEGSRGLAASELATGDRPPELETLVESIVDDGGSVLAVFRDPLGGAWQILAGLPIDRVEPTPFQRDLSDTHAKRLTQVIDQLGRFLDPIIAVRNDDGVYWTPNGLHRREAMTRLGARSIVALVVPEREVAYSILALNTEKAHNLREKSLEVIRMARSLAELDPRPETDYALRFEEPALLTLGICYESRGRYSGGTYNPVVKRLESFLEAPLPEALEERTRRAEKLLALDDAVGEAVARLKERGFENPFLKPFVVARINPIRFQRGGSPDFDETIDKMLESARGFDAGKVRADQIAAAAGPAEE